MSKRLIAGILTACLMFQNISIQSLAASDGQVLQLETETVTETVTAEEASIEECSEDATIDPTVTEEPTREDTVGGQDAQAIVKSIVPVEGNESDAGKFSELQVDFYGEYVEILSGSFENLTDYDDVTFYLNEYEEDVTDLETATPIYKTEIEKGSYNHTKIAQDGKIYTFNLCYNEDNMLLALDTKYVRVGAEIDTGEADPTIVYSNFIERDSFPDVKMDKVDILGEKVDSITIRCELSGLSDEDLRNDVSISIWEPDDANNKEELYLARDYVDVDDSILMVCYTDAGKNVLKPSTKYQMQIDVNFNKYANNISKTLSRASSEVVTFTTGEDKDINLVDSFPDEAFRALVIQRLGLAAEATTAKKSAMENIIGIWGTYSEGDAKIESLAGIGLFPNLQEIQFVNYGITTVPEEDLAKLPVLSEVDLSKNNLTKIPDLSTNCQLSSLKLDQNYIPAAEFDNAYDKVHYERISNFETWISRTRNTQYTSQEDELFVVTEDVYYGNSSNMPFFVQISGYHDDISNYTLKAKIDGTEYVMTYNNYSNISGVFYVDTTVAPADEKKTVTLSLYKGEEAVLVDSEDVSVEFAQNKAALCDRAIYASSKQNPSGFYIMFTIDSLRTIQKVQMVQNGILVESGNASSVNSYNRDARYTKIDKDGFYMSNALSKVGQYYFYQNSKPVFTGNYDLRVTYTDGDVELIKDAIIYTEEMALSRVDVSFENDNVGEYIYAVLYGVNIDPAAYKVSFRFNGKELETEYISSKYTNKGVLLIFKKKNWPDNVNRVVINVSNNEDVTLLESTSSYISTASIYYCDYNKVKNTLMLGLTSDVPDGEGLLVLMNSAGNTVLNKKVTLQGGYMEQSLEDLGENSGSYTVRLRLHGATHTSYVEVDKTTGYFYRGWDGDGMFPQGTQTATFTYRTTSPLKEGKYIAEIPGYQDVPQAEVNVSTSGVDTLYTMTLDISKLQNAIYDGCKTYVLSMHLEGDTTAEITTLMYIYPTNPENKFIIASNYTDFETKLNYKGTMNVSFLAINCKASDVYTVKLKDYSHNVIVDDLQASSTVVNYKDNIDTVTLNLTGIDLDEIGEYRYIEISNNRLGEAYLLDGFNTFYNSHDAVLNLRLSTLGVVSADTDLGGPYTIGLSFGNTIKPIQVYIYEEKDDTLLSRFTVTEEDCNQDGQYFFTQELIDTLTEQNGADGLCDIVAIDAEGSAGVLSGHYLKHVTAPNPVTKVTLDKTKVTLAKDETVQLNATMIPVDATVGNRLVWTSTKSSVAKVDSTGLVTATGHGEAVITVATSNSLIASCAVTVVPFSVHGATVSGDDLIIEEQGLEDVISLHSNYAENSQRIIAVTGNSNTPVFATSNAQVATVTKMQGKDAATIKAVGVGTAIVSVTADGVTKEIAVEVTVRKNIQGIALNTTDVELESVIGATQGYQTTTQIYASFLPFDAEYAEDSTIEQSFTLDHESDLVTITPKQFPESVGTKSIHNTYYEVTSKEGVFGTCTATFTVTVNGTPYTEAVSISVKGIYDETKREEVKEDITNAIQQVILTNGETRTLDAIVLEDRKEEYSGWTFSWVEPKTKLKADSNMPIQYFTMKVTAGEQIEDFYLQIPVSITSIKSVKLVPVGEAIGNAGSRLVYNITYESVGDAPQVSQLNGTYSKDDATYQIVNKQADETLKENQLAIYIKDTAKAGTYTALYTVGAEQWGSKTLSAGMKFTVTEDELISAIVIESFTPELDDKVLTPEIGTNVEVDYLSVKSGNAHVYLRAKYDTSRGEKDVLAEKLLDTFKITSSDSSVVKIENKEGYTYLNLKKAGTAVITVTAKDAGKCSYSFALSVVDATPILSVDKVTLNKYWVDMSSEIYYTCDSRLSAPTEVEVVDKDEQTLEQYEYNYSQLDYKDGMGIGKLGLKNTDTVRNRYIKKTTDIVYLKFTIGEKSYVSAPVKVTIDVTKPTATVKNIQKANVYHQNATAVYTVTSKDKIGSISSNNANTGAGEFGFAFRVKEDVTQITYTANSKLSANSYQEYMEKKSVRCADTIHIHFDGYIDAADMEKSLAVAVENKKNSLTADTAMIYEGMSSVEVAVKNKKTKEPVTLQNANISVAPNQKLPERVSVVMKEDGTKLVLDGVSEIDAANIKLNIILEGTTQALPITLRVEKTDTPEIVLEKKTVTLNSNLPISKTSKTEIATAMKGNEKLLANNGVTIAGDKKAMPLIAAGYLHVAYKNGILSTWLDGDKPKDAVLKGNYSVTIKGRVVMEDGTTVETKPVKLTIKISEKTPSVKLKASGSINLVDRANTAVTYTPTVKETEGNLTGVAVSGRDAEYFTAKLENGKIVVNAKSGKAMRTKYKYTFDLKLTLDSGVEIVVSKVSIIPKQKLPKVTFSSKNGNVLSRTIDYSSTQGLLIDISGVMVAPDSMELVNNKAGAGVELSGNQLRLSSQTGKQKKAGTYTISIRYKVVDAAINVKPSVVKFKVIVV